MMSPQADPKLLRSIRATQRSLGEYVCKPPLLEKYLVKPPFRFIHDIVCNVINNTGFMKNTFTPGELKYDNISSPDDKRDFLKKMIDTIESFSGEACAARTSKILAGKEPEKTNELLQSLAKAIANSARAEVKPVESQKTIKESKKSKAKDDSGPKKSTKSKSASSHPPAPKTKPSQAASASKEKLVKADQKKVERQATPTPSTSKVSLPTVKKSLSNEIPKMKQEASKQATKSVSSSSSLVKKSPSKLQHPIVPSRKASLVKVSSQTRINEEIRKDSKEKLAVALNDLAINAGENQDTSQPATNATPNHKNENYPWKRPVTRTKYRQGNGEDDPTSGSKDNTGSGHPSAEDVSIHQNQEPSDGGNEEEKKDVHLVEEKEIKPDLVEDEENNNDRVEEEESKGSSRTTSSDEVITEHMNQKISEWRATSAEEPHEQATFKRGWITSEAEQEVTGRGNVGGVFGSDENCSVEGAPSNAKIVPGSEKDEDEPNMRGRSLNRNKQSPMMRPVTVIMDNEEEDDEDESYLVQERKEASDEMVNQGYYGSSESGMMSQQDNRSMLVNQILETQRELERFNANGFPDSQKELAERDQEAMREIYLKQVEDLKEAIQKITKCANPLSNITQRSQDDACLMEIEFRKLRHENERLDKKIAEAKAETSKILYPYTAELTNLDKCIEKMEGAIALAQQRLHIMDEEYGDNFLEQIAQTPTEDEHLEANQFKEAAGANQLWGGIPHSDVIKDDEEFELKMRNTSMRQLFQAAVNMHDGTGDYDRGGFRLMSHKQRSSLVRSRPSRSKPIQQQRQHHRHHKGRTHISDFYGSGGYSGGYSGGGAPASVLQGARQSHQQQHQQYPPMQQQQQQFFGFGRGSAIPLQREPQVESEIRPSWWD